MLIFGSLGIESSVNAEIFNIKISELFSQEPYRFNLVVLMSFVDTYWLESGQNGILFSSDED